MRDVNFAAYQKRKVLLYWLVDNLSVKKVCQKCKCIERSLWCWKKIYDGALESLEPKSYRPKTPYPNEHKPEEVENI